MYKKESNVREWNKIFRTKIVLKILEWVSESHSVVSDSLWPHGLLCPWNSPGKNMGVGCYFLLQRIFPTQGFKLGLLNYRWTLYQLSHQDTTKYLFMNVHSSSILNSQKVETTQMATSRWFNKKNYGIYMQWSFIQPLKGMKYRYMLQHGWILKIFCSVKETRYKT